jgi:hypothetical protein
MKMPHSLNASLVKPGHASLPAPVNCVIGGADYCEADPYAANFRSCAQQLSLFAANRQAQARLIVMQL